MTKRNQDNPNLYYWSSERHGVPILNAKNPVDTAIRFLTADEKGEIGLSELKMFDYEVPRLTGFAVIPRFRITHNLKDDGPGEFDGQFVGEEYHGGVHPLLLLDPSEVTERRKP